ncbi:MAG: SPOR domain-containing protein [Gammaproteobacteria bacterium]|nr:SPOR domain-containing protein [Gammaproteobacteria bacterium]
MNQTTRQRITGTLVLAVVALVLLPVIFDGEGSYQPSVQPEIPTRPVQPQAAFQDPQRPVITADSDAIRIRPETPAEASTAETIAATPTTVTPMDRPTEADSDAVSDTAAEVVDQPANQPAAPVVSAPSAPTPTQSASLDVQGLPEGWSVRLGSFSSAENASNLVTRLQEAGHRAYTRRIESTQGPLTAVFVGPQVDRSAAQNLMERLRQDFQLNGMVVRYEIEQ